jgi:hypothetical protein
MIRMLSFTAAVLLVPAVATAEQYWIAYDGDDFPEKVGWRRHFGNEHGPGQGGAERWIEDGVFVLDSLRHDQIFDFYDVQRPIGPGPGEYFVAAWRACIDVTFGEYDSEVVIARDDPPGHVAIEYDVDLATISTNGVSFPIAPGLFHTYRVESDDMEQFVFFIDGTAVHIGEFDSDSVLQSFVAFGDGVQGARSLSQWDYFRFGVVPEPGVLWLFAGGLLTWCCWRSCHLGRPWSSAKGD